MKDNHHKQLLTELTDEFEATPAFNELDDEVAASCSGGRISFGGSNPDVILFEDTNFGGASLRINATSGDGDDNLDNALVGSGWNNRTSSISVIRGTWQIFESDGYKGRSKTLTSRRYANSGEFGLPNDSLTAIRRLS